MKTIDLLNTTAKMRKDLQFPHAHNEVRDLHNQKELVLIAMAWSTPIVDKGTTLMSNLNTCREVLIGHYAKWQNAAPVIKEPRYELRDPKKLFDRLYNPFVLKELNLPNPHASARKILNQDRRVRFVMLVKGPYPTKASASFLKTFKKDFYSAAKNVLSIMHILDKAAGFELTQVYDLNTKPLLKGGHLLGIMIEGDPHWGDCPQMLSLYLLVARMALRSHPSIKKVSFRTLSGLIDKAKKIRQSLSSIPYYTLQNTSLDGLKKDVNQFVEIAPKLNRFLSHYERFRGQRTRESFFKFYKHGGMITDGIHKLLCAESAADTDVTIALRNVLK